MYQKGMFNTHRISRNRVIKIYKIYKIYIIILLKNVIILICYINLKMKLILDRIKLDESVEC